MRTLKRFHKGFGGLFSEGVEGVEDEDGGEAVSDGFIKQFGWIYSTKQVAEFEGITMDAAYELGLIQYMNDLVYLKEYGEHTKRMNANIIGK